MLDSDVVEDDLDSQPEFWGLLLLSGFIAIVAASAFAYNQISSLRYEYKQHTALICHSLYRKIESTA